MQAVVATNSDHIEDFPHVLDKDKNVNYQNSLQDYHRGDLVN